MSDVIKLLPDSVANQIAAGEVIQRPASVIKELVENAIDAKADNIQIILKDAGRTLIQIIDNGVGMTDTDARLAFERHSTSKIRTADDLFTLTTMGFRGEALASICAIAQVELRTRTHDAQLGTRLVINGSVCESQEPDMCPPGSNFMIKNIFYNVPARRKFLKSNEVELNNIVREFEKLAMVNHNVEFTLMNNGHLMYKLQPGTFLQRVTALMGKAFESQLIPVNVDTTLVRISGYVSKPEAARKRNYKQFLFVNERYMKHPYFHKAILSCYDQLIPQDEQPNYFLRFTVDPESIDVNIHPTKTEIKFENEQPIWQILAAGVKEAVGRYGDVPNIEFDTEGAPEIPAFQQRPTVEPPKIDIDPGYNPFRQGTQAPSYHRQAVSNWEELYRNFENSKREASQAITDDDLQLLDSPGPEPSTPAEPTEQRLMPDEDSQATFLQFKGRYIVVPMRSGLMLVDQHRAHLRILFDRYISQLTEHSIASQAVLFPEVLHLSPGQSALLASLQGELERIGFGLSRLSGEDWSVVGVPSGIEGVNASDVVMQVIESVEQGGAPVRSRVMEHIALKVAESAAIAYGRRLTQDEMNKLVSDLLRAANPNYTPDGNTIISVISTEQIYRLF
ncbi:MAG: DNA mismatch repair endonuclease MutL [Muribaculaceae bacterium]|nr:DNA mismatch repair endonuclease MutL [Muribaculaceae bacterium]